MFYLPPGQGGTDTARWPVPRGTLHTASATVFGSALIQCGQAEIEREPLVRLRHWPMTNCPELRPRGRGLVCVRSLRTQQCVNYRCQCLIGDLVFEVPLVYLVVMDLAFGLYLQFFDGEFDPGSGRTLAACLTHASRTMNPSGGLVANG